MKNENHSLPENPYLTPRPVALSVSCLNLRHKLMYCDERHAVPGLVDANSTTRLFFCIKTCDGLGPDEKPVHPDSCHGSRGCYCSPGGETTPAPDRV
ncbi:MAG: hypothetical protein ACT4PL_11600 [Phycisphaerales bacterium]